MRLKPAQSHQIGPAFVTRHFTGSSLGQPGDISSLVVCSEKPDIGCVERVLDEIIEKAPSRVYVALRPLSDLRAQWRSSAFLNNLNRKFVEAAKDVNSIAWTPPKSIEERLIGLHLLSNDGITSDTNWFDAFVRQVSTVRLCHVRHISKKGCDLTGRRHFDAHLTPEDHESYKGRVEAAMEFLNTANIPLQARQLLLQAFKKSGYGFQGKFDLYVFRPVKDYADHSNSYNFLTAVYTKLLRDALTNVARAYFPTSHIQIHDEPVMMLTKTNRTDADSLGRIVKQPLFEIGDVEGKHVIIADDHINAGAFTATLMSQAEEKGACVVGIASFSRHPNSGTLTLKPRVKSALLGLYPQETLDTVLARVGVSVDTLTNREGLTLLSILMDGSNDNHRNVFQGVMSEVNGEYNHLLDGIGDDLGSELHKSPKTPQELLMEINDMFSAGSVR